MEVIVYSPHSMQGQVELSKRVAAVHAQIIYTYISRLDCPTDQKIAILNMIQSSIRDDIKKEKEGYALIVLGLISWILSLVRKIRSVIR